MKTTTKKAASKIKVTLPQAIRLEGAADGDVYYVRQDEETLEFYVTSQQGINTLGSSDFKDLSAALKYATDSIKRLTGYKPVDLESTKVD